MWRRRNVYLIAMVTAALAVFPAAFFQPRLLDDLRNFIFDSFQRAEPRPYDPQAPVKIVGIDEESLKIYGQWPWPRTRLAELTDRLAALGASAIAFDFIFAEPDRTSFEFMATAIPSENLRRDVLRTLAKTPSNDQVFARALGASPSILGETLAANGATTAPERKGGFVTAGDDPAPFLPYFPAIAAPIALLAQAAPGLGATNWLPDRDQVVRRAMLFGVGPFGVVPSLAMEALRIAQGETTYILRSSNASGETAFGRHTGMNAVKIGAFEIATGPNGEVRPRYTAASPQRTISAAAVLKGSAQRDDIEGRIVFVGAKATGLGDIRATPLEPAVSGVDIHAQIVESLVSGSLLSRPDWAFGLEYLLAFVFFVFVAVILLYASPVASAFIAAVGVALLFGASFVLFEKRGLLLDPGFPSATIILSYLVGTSTLWRFEQTAKRHVHEAFGKFVAPAVVDRLAENPDRLVLGGETRELSVLFCDLRDFSGLSEGMSAQELTQFMNEYLTPMTDTILERAGTIDKYMGDAILAFWNAPLDVEDHPRKAVDSALTMRSELTAFNAARKERAQQEGRVFREAAMGVGLALGPCSVGNMGSIRRFDYSILGDIVNLASRLDGVTKMFRTDIVAAYEMCDATKDYAWLDLGDVVVIGRNATTRIATLVGDASFAQSPEFMEWKNKHDAVFDAYRSRRFTEAADGAARLAGEVSSRWSALYIGLRDRFAALRDKQLLNDWSPIWVLDSK
jgi:adenylate cyclase